MEADSKEFAAPASIPPSIILGAELFYLHDVFYRGLIGRVIAFDRAVDAVELKKLSPAR